MEFLFVDYGIRGFRNSPHKQFLFVEEARIWPADKAEDALLKIAKQPDFSHDITLRKAVVRAIRKVPTPSTRELLKLLTQDRHREVRAASAYSLKAFPDIETLEDYSRLAQDTTREVRLACIPAIGEFIYNLLDFTSNHTDIDLERTTVIDIYEQIWQNSFWDRDKIAHRFVESLHNQSFLCFDEIEDNVAIRARFLCNQAAKSAYINLLHT